MGYGIKPPTTDMCVTMADASNPDVPMVKVVDAEGKELLRGWYFRLPYTTHCFGECTEFVEGVVTASMVDWELPNRMEVKAVTPPERIVPLEVGA